GKRKPRLSSPAPQRAAYKNSPPPASRSAVVGVFVARTAERGVRVGVTGAGPCAFRATAFEQALLKNFTADALKGVSVPAAGLNSDIHAGADYRAHLIGVLARPAGGAAALKRQSIACSRAGWRMTPLRPFSFRARHEPNRPHRCDFRRHLAGADGPGAFAGADPGRADDTGRADQARCRRGRVGHLPSSPRGRLGAE